MKCFMFIVPVDVLQSRLHCLYKIQHISDKNTTGLLSPEGLLKSVNINNSIQ